MSPFTPAVLPLLLSTISLLQAAAAQTTTTTVYPYTTYTSLGYSLTEVVIPSTVSQYTLATPPVCPEGYGTFEGDICLAPNAGYSVQPSTTEAPIFVTLTVPELSAGGPSTTETIDGHTDTGYTDLTATKTETLTVSNLYCPPPLSAYGDVCVTANDTASFTAAKSATMSFNSTATVAYTAAAAAATTSDVKTADTATTTRGTTNPFGISLGGPATTITSGGSTFTRYSASGGVLNSLTSSATAATTVAPYKGDAAGRVGGGAIGGMGAAGAAALWML